MNSPTQRHLMLAVRSILATSLAAAACAGAAESQDPIETVRVFATAVDEDPENISSSYSILEGQKLRERTRATLGDTLNGLPGVNADTFGGGSARPVIRGQTAPRVKVLSDSIAILDASDISPDHAVAVEPSLVERIEVLRGPATLLYGSGAIGGVVNVLDRKVPSTLPEERVTGTLALRGGSVADERAGALGITARATDHLVFRVEGAARDADDYRAPGLDESRVDGTAAESASGSVGVAWIADRGYLGLAYTYRDDDYGLPGHNHEYEGCHPHGSLLHCGSHDEEEPHEHEEGEHGAPPNIALLSKTFELRGELSDPFAGVERIRLRANQTDYRHNEMEEGLVATTFLNEGYEARIEAQHAPLLGWRGVVGVQYANTQFSALGEEAFLPTVDTQSVGIFAVEHYQLADAWHLEAGARQEWLRHQPVDDPRSRPEFSDSATSVSAAVIWEFQPDYFLTLSGARSQRLPHAQELYARGIHLATNTYECGLVPHPLTCGGLENNAPFDTETSNNVELRINSTVGALTFSVGGYYNKVDDYIYARTLDRFEDFRLIKYTQRDAQFVGTEAEVTYGFSDALTATVFGDYVRARFTDDGNLPRIPAARVGTRLNATLRNFAGEFEYYRANRQSDIADHESPTPGYDMLNLTVSYRTGGGTGVEMFLRGSNLLDEEIRNHASFLAGVVPLPGRNVTAGVTLSF